MNTKQANQNFGSMGDEVYREDYADDKGWEFDPEVLVQPGDMTTAKLHLKWRLPIFPPAADNAYFDANGEIREWLSDSAYWDPVDSHRLRIEFDSMSDTNGFPLPLSKDYVYFVNESGQPIDGFPLFVDATTDGSGIATVYLKAGPLIHQVKEFNLKAVDRDVFSSP